MAERTGASERPRGVGWRLWLLWVLASVVGGVVGMVATSLAIRVFAPVVDIVAGMAIGSLGWALFAVVDEFAVGVGVGVLQWLVLSRHLARTDRWIVASAVGWAIGRAVAVTTALVFLALGLPVSVGLGWSGLVGWFAVGAGAGVLQWLVLRRHLARASWWIVASVVGWGGGSIAGGLLQVLLVAYGEFESASAYIAIIGMTAGGAAVYGAITGAALVWLLGQRLE